MGYFEKKSKLFSTIALIVLGMAALSLAGCNSTQAPAPAPQAIQRSNGVTQPGFKLPEGAGCSSQVARYQAVIDNDQNTGHIGPSVYAAIQGDIARASAACQAGKDGEAMAILRSSKSNHGYPG